MVQQAIFENISQPNARPIGGAMLGRLASLDLVRTGYCCLLGWTWYHYSPTSALFFLQILIDRV
jgi:hypothetical protein